MENNNKRVNVGSSREKKKKRLQCFIAIPGLSQP